MRSPLTWHAHVTLTSAQSHIHQACGLEILVSRAGGVAGGRGEGGRREDVTSDHRWDKFVHNLNENGYFQVWNMVLGNSDGIGAFTGMDLYRMSWRAPSCTNSCYKRPRSTSILVW